MKNAAAAIKELVQRLIFRFRKPDSVQSAPVKYDDARMSYTRLQALEGPGYRQCYMEKLREADNSHDVENKERWLRAPSEPAVDPMEAQLAKRKKRLTQAQHKMSYTRLQALVQQMPPEQRLLNEEEARRLGGVSLPPLDV